MMPEDRAIKDLGRTLNAILAEVKTLRKELKLQRESQETLSSESKSEPALIDDSMEITIIDDPVSRLDEYFG